jgi:hypothetical protein
MMRGNNLGLESASHTTGASTSTSSSGMSSMCDQQHQQPEEQEWRKPKSRRQRRKRKGARNRNVPLTEQTFVSAGPGKFPTTATSATTTTASSSPTEFTLSQPVKSSRVRPVDVASTSAAAATADTTADTTSSSGGDTSQDPAFSPSTHSNTETATPTAPTPTALREKPTRIAMKRSLAVLEKRMAQAHQHQPNQQQPTTIETPSGKENAGVSSSETEKQQQQHHSSFHTTPDKVQVPQDNKDKQQQQQPTTPPTMVENGALPLPLETTDKLQPPTSSSTTTTPAKERRPQDEDTIISPGPAPGSVNNNHNSSSGNDDDDNRNVNIKNVRVIRFADEVGQPLVDYHAIGGKDDPHATGRIIIMLLNPQQRKFEFIHAEFLRSEQTTVADLLYQIPQMASNELFRNTTTFTHICRTRNGNTDLDNDRILQDYDMEDSELVIGVLEGFSGKEMAQCALPLLLNGKITQAVSTVLYCTVLL